MDLPHMLIVRVEIGWWRIAARGSRPAELIEREVVVVAVSTGLVAHRAEGWHAHQLLTLINFSAIPLRHPTAARADQATTFR
jgi:hypothetical protein